MALYKYQERKESIKCPKNKIIALPSTYLKIHVNGCLTPLSVHCVLWFSNVKSDHEVGVFRSLVKNDEKLENL